MRRIRDDVGCGIFFLIVWAMICAIIALAFQVSRLSVPGVDVSPTPTPTPTPRVLKFSKAFFEMRERAWEQPRPKP